MSNNTREQQGFSSLMGFLLSIIGFAIGAGSMWRFPYVTGTNGGALFILTYIVVIVLIGIPLLMAEISIGYRTQKTPVYAYQELCPDKPWYVFGYLHFFIAMLLVGYIIPIYAWILAYIWRTGTSFFTTMTPDAIQNAFTTLTTDYKTMFLFAAINQILIALAVKNKLDKGIERINMIMLPLLALIMVVCIIIGLQYDNASAGVAFLLKPDWSQFSFQSVTTAVGQAFFAVGIGMLASMVFGSYIKRKNANLLRDSSIISTGIIGAGVASGLMIFPVVFAFSMEPAAGVGLTMITLPNVFNNMTAGRWVGMLFYVGFYFAAFTTAIALYEAMVSVLMNMLHMTRKKALAVVMLLTSVIGACAIALPGFLDTADVLTSNYLLIISGFAITIFAGWVWGTDNMLAAASVKNPLLRIWLTWSVKYICPLAIFIVFLGNFL